LIQIENIKNPINEYEYKGFKVEIRSKADNLIISSDNLSSNNDVSIKIFTKLPN